MGTYLSFGDGVGDLICEPLKVDAHRLEAAPVVRFGAFQGCMPIILTLLAQERCEAGTVPSTGALPSKVRRGDLYSARDGDVVASSLPARSSCSASLVQRPFRSKAATLGIRSGRSTSRTSPRSWSSG